MDASTRASGDIFCTRLSSQEPNFGTHRAGKRAATVSGVAGRAWSAGGCERSANCVCDDAGVHHLTFDDRVCEQRRDGDLDELRVAATMIDDCYLDQSGADIESDCGLLATEERHVGGR